MISLITGVPGSGKTAWLVHQLMTRKDLQNRPLFVDGIPELKVPHLPVPEGETMATWPDWAPTGAIIVVDECQRVFRPRRSGSDVPKYIAEFETHRHRGLDFFLLTQNPRLIDANVRDLVGEHRHIGKTLIGIRRMLYWNTGGAKNPSARRDIAEAVSSMFFLPRKAFGMYKSAEEHNGLKGKISKLVYIFPVVLVVLAALMYQMQSRYEQRTASAAETAAPLTTDERAALAISEEGGNGQYSATPPQAASEPKPAITAEMYIPALDGKPWTAPIYAPHNTQIATMPYPVGCVQSGDKCTCYTDQATPIQGMDKGLCLDFVQNGIYNPHKATSSTAPQAVRDSQG